jgi:hypothetical protein
MVVFRSSIGRTCETAPAVDEFPGVFMRPVFGELGVEVVDALERAAGQEAALDRSAGNERPKKRPLSCAPVGSSVVELH